MKYLSYKDLGAHFRDSSTGAKIVLIGIPKRLDQKKADAGIFGFPDGSEIERGAGTVEIWTKDHDMQAIAAKPMSQMTLHDRAALAAMQGILANPNTKDTKGVITSAFNLADQFISNSLPS